MWHGSHRGMHGCAPSRCRLLTFACMLHICIELATRNCVHSMESWKWFNSANRTSAWVNTGGGGGRGGALAGCSVPQKRLRYGGLPCHVGRMPEAAGGIKFAVGQRDGSSGVRARSGGSVIGAGCVVEQARGRVAAARRRVPHGIGGALPVSPNSASLCISPSRQALGQARARGPRFPHSPIGRSVGLAADSMTAGALSASASTLAGPRYHHRRPSGTAATVLPLLLLAAAVAPAAAQVGAVQRTPERPGQQAQASRACCTVPKSPIQPPHRAGSLTTLSASWCLATGAAPLKREAPDAPAAAGGYTPPGKGG